MRLTERKNKSQKNIKFKERTRYYHSSMIIQPLLKRKILRWYGRAEKSILPYFTETYHKWEEYAFFMILLQTTHFLLGWITIKPILDFYNDIYFLFAISTSLFFISYPPALIETDSTKHLSLHTDSFVYLLFYTIPIIILSIPWDIWTHYVFSSSNIQQWGVLLWIIFVLNLCIFIPFILKNLILAYQYNELWFHVGGYGMTILLLFPAFIIKSINLHIHHWFFSAFFICFSRFPERPSRVFHAICLGIFIQGISFYGADAIFE